LIITALLTLTLAPEATITALTFSLAMGQIQTFPAGLMFPGSIRYGAQTGNYHLYQQASQPEVPGKCMPAKQLYYAYTK
jgi:hypothetical protein